MRVQIAIILFSIALPLWGQAQEDLPNLSNYQHNWMIYNPAFTGSRDVMSAGVYTRALKIKDPGGPFYLQGSFHTPSKNEKVAYGAYFSRQKSPTIFLPLGTNINTHFTDWQLYGSYAYRIKGPRGRLSMGLYGGATVTTAKYSDDFLHSGDPTFPVDDIQTKLNLNVGAGLLYYTEKLFLGFSIPRLIPTDSIFSAADSSGVVGFLKNYTGVFSGGYEFAVNENLCINPTFILLYGVEDPLNYAGGINFGLFDKKIWFGMVYKSANSLAFNVNLQLNNKLLMGIAYDYSLDSKNTYFKNAFEFLLRWELRETVQTNIPFYY